MDEIGKQTAVTLALSTFKRYVPHFPNLTGVVVVSCLRGGQGMDKLWGVIERVTHSQAAMGELIPTRLYHFILLRCNISNQIFRYFQLEEIVKNESTKRLPPIISRDELLKMCSLVTINEAEFDYVTTILQRFGALFYWGNDALLKDIGTTVLHYYSI